MSRATKMSAASPQGALLPMELPSMSFAAASPVKTSVLAEGGPELTAPARGSGLKWLGLLANFDLDTFSWRTSQTCLLARANGRVDGLPEFSETWPRSGMMRSGIAYRLEPLAPLTSATGFGLWPTPTVIMTGDNRTLEQFDAARARALIKQKGRTGNGIGEDLAIAVKRRMWPTPIKRGGRTFLGAKRSPNALGSEPLVTQAGGNLNPPWVAWLMGFPETWLDCASVPLNASGTPSSRKSQK